MARQETKEEIQRDTIRMISTLHDRMTTDPDKMVARWDKSEARAQERHEEQMASSREFRREMRESFERLNGKSHA